MSSLSIFNTLFLFQLKVFWHNRNEITNALAFFLISITTFHIAISPEHLEIKTAVAIIYCSLTFAMILGSSLLFTKDYNDGFLKQLYLMIQNKELILFSKYTSFSIMFIIMNALTLPIAFIFFNIPLENFLLVLISSILLIACVSIILIFASMICLNTESFTLISILILPLIIPILIFTTLTISEHYYIYILLGIYLLILPIFLLSSKKIFIVAWL
jgi:heme exporter protein B